MSKFSHYTHLVYFILYLILAICGFIFPATYGQYVTIIVGSVLIIIGVLTLIDNIRQKMPLPYLIPSFFIIAGIVLVAFFEVILSFLMIVTGIILILMGLAKLSQIPYYTAINQKPYTPIILSILYIGFGIAITVIASLAIDNPDLYYKILGYIIATGFVLLSVDSILRYLKHQNNDLQQFKIGKKFDNSKSKTIDVDVTSETIIDDDNK